MKNLIEISKIVTKKKVRKIEILDDATLDNKNSKFGEFYDALMAGKFRNDRDAATLLYKCSPTDDKYRQLKSRFRKRLLNTLFFIDINQPNTSSYERAYFSCQKEWTLVNILMLNGAHFTGIETARQILTIAQKYKFSDIIINCTRLLRQYAAINDNEKEYEIYDALVKECTDIADAEVRSEELYQRVFMKYNMQILSVDDCMEQLEEYCDSLVSMSETYDSPVIMYNTLLVWTHRFEMIKDFESMLQVCHRAEKYIESNPIYLQEDKLATFQIKKMSVYLHLRDFKGGKSSIEKSLQYFPDGSETWFLFLEYYILLAFHTDNFIQALAILNRAKGHPKFKKLNNETKDKWKIFEVYVHYFVGLENENLLKVQSTGNFSENQFVKDPLLYPKAYRIFTVHMVIAQVLFLLGNNNQAASERIDRLRLYGTKQLDKDVNFRMIAFIRLLVQLAKADFDISSVTVTDRYYESLIGHPFYFRGMLNELEIVPFGRLWNHIVERLK